ncbi:hypothetical protein ACTXT7_002197 [Hymenolepis weldensis]
MSTRLQIPQDYHIQLLGKLHRQALRTTINPDHYTGRLLYVSGRNSKLKFLIDTESEASVIPRSFEKRFLQPISLTFRRITTLRSPLTIKTSLAWTKDSTANFVLISKNPLLVLISPLNSTYCNTFSNILPEFPSVFHAQSEIEVRHNIITNGSPVFAKALRLHADKLQADKNFNTWYP